MSAVLRMTDWTPGPWRSVESVPAEGAHVFWITGGEGKHETDVATVAGGKIRNRSNANANLIAAAPDLYAALAEATPNHPALAKARGEAVAS